MKFLFIIFFIFCSVFLMPGPEPKPYPGKSGKGKYFLVETEDESKEFDKGLGI